MSTKANKTIKDVVKEAKRVIGKKDGEIQLLKRKLKTATGEKAVVFKMPDEVTVSNFPAELSVTVKNQPKTQDVHVLNLKDIKIEKTEVKFPEVQEVSVKNFPAFPEQEKASSWLPQIIAHAVKSLTAAWVKRLDMGIIVKLDDTERMKPMPVYMVDWKGRPMNPQPPQSTMIAMGGNRVVANPAPPTKIGSGRIKLTAANTLFQLVSAPTPCRYVTITSLAANDDMIYVGDKSTSSVSGSEQGAQITPTGSVTLQIDDVSKVYASAVSINNNVLTFTYQS